MPLMETEADGEGEAAGKKKAPAVVLRGLEKRSLYAMRA